ncbi:SMP-30/gluconolactonase/LRE family protein [Hephaestia sp. GCM10023244]|uniref:SMP-30/gluconolactonase/LRE family protein n=1 Tax=unclassified Hephaestia TaxID=2631281 RepID=UPI002077419D|nr:SMP-30/gluconolactonase/LRE family protein [Hephaestia sp. MAHUQ-44]MCM8732450.1 SMP-30/gluconolactonase/LRE family protein [Hephaestia sp. MAHUQ-44]
MAAPRIIARDRRDRLGEGPIWSARDEAVYWVDIMGQRLNRLRLADDRVETWDMPDILGWVIEREAAPGFVAGLGRSIVGLLLDPVTIEPITSIAGEPDTNRVNDAKADPEGRIYLGTMPVACDAPSGALYRLVDDAIVRLDAGYTIPNGPAFSLDGCWMYHADSRRRAIFRYPRLSDGALGERQDWVRFGDGWGDPDGMAVDAEGGLWVACWGAGCVARFSPDGQRERTIAVPTPQVTSCVFAGPALDRMFVTSEGDGSDDVNAGALFEIDPGCRGLPGQPYRG